MVSAALWGLAHFYQGPSGMVNVAITGIILAVVYLRFGRVWPLIICHYLQAAFQISLFLYMMCSGLV
ncbi:CPBP family intramembrane glutamic endopeptidase [Chloroflexota bacterium]